MRKYYLILIPTISALVHIAILHLPIEIRNYIDYILIYISIHLIVETFFKDKK